MILIKRIKEGFKKDRIFGKVLKKEKFLEGEWVEIGLDKEDLEEKEEDYSNV